MPEENTPESAIDAAIDSSQTVEDRDEKLAVKSLMKDYQEARDFDENARKQYGIDRSYASGQKQKNWASDANLIGSFIDILVSFLYARDPDVSALAAKVVGGTKKEASDFAETAGIIVSRLWKKGRLKKAARKVVRSSLSVGPGWLKVVMTHETKRDPIVAGELNDLEDNVQRLQFTLDQIEEDNELDTDEIKVKLQEAELLQASLRDKVEVIHRSGMAIDYVQAEDMQVSIDVPDVSDHLDGDWNGNEIYVRVTDLGRRFDRLTTADIKHAVVYYQLKPKKHVPDDVENIMDFGSKTAGSRFTKANEVADTEGVAFARVIEVWDKRDNHVKTIVEGIKRWAVEPYPPPLASSRFYPYFNLSLFEVDGSRHPQSLSGRLAKLQDEYSSKRSNSRLAAERSVPGTIFDATAITKEDARKIENSVSMEMIGVKPVKGDDLRKAFAAKPVPTVDPLVFDTRSILSDMERLSGVQEALSSAVSVQKTATEAKIQDQGFNSRSAADRDTLEDVLQDLAEYTLELAIQGVPYDQAVRLAGPRAFWPVDMDIDDIITLAEVDIKAGSTGKPDDESLRNSWSILLPLVQTVMQAIQQAQFTGNMPMAEALKNLLAETMRRLDERIDVEQFIPQGLPNLQGVPQLGGDGAPEPAPDTGPNNAADANTLV